MPIPTSRDILPSLEARHVRPISGVTGKDFANPVGFGAVGPPPPLGWVRVESDDGLRFETILDETPPRVTGGYGGWSEVERPRQKPITTWVGCPPYRMELGVIFEGWAWDVSVEESIATLEKMCRRAAGNHEPPKVRVALPANRPRSPRVDWVIEGLEWGDSLRSEDASQRGERTRQHATLTLLEYVPEELIRESPSRKRRKAKAKQKPKKGRRR